MSKSTKVVLGSRIKLPMHELAAYTAFSERMQERSAVRKVRGLEENILSERMAWTILRSAPTHMNIERRQQSIHDRSGDREL